MSAARQVLDTGPGLIARQKIRAGRITTSTAGLAPGYVQANIVILPSSSADHFAAYCKSNPQACPLLAMSKPGDPALPALGCDIDIRSDLPGYQIFRNGEFAGETTDIEAVWSSDLVTFAIGCSFTFEAALIAAGIPLRHVLQGRNVAMYRTNRPTQTVGPFQGPLVVSMRPIEFQDAARASEITAKFHDMHGAPVQIGYPEVLGIRNLMQPDYGDAVSIEAGEIPVFWACGVTSQVAAQSARLPILITHAPGKMLITDVLYSVQK